MREWTTLKKYIWLLLLRGASAIIHTVTGTAPLVLENAIAAAIKSLKQYGKCTQPSGVWNTAITQYGLCEQDGTPTPDAPVDIMTNNGALKVRRQSGLPLGYQMVEWLKPTNAIPITGFKTKSTQEITTVFYRESSASSYLYWSDTASSGMTNTTAYLTTSGGNWRWDGKTYSIGVSSGITITSVQNKDGVWLNGTKYGYYTDADEFVSTNDLSLASYTNTSVRIYSMIIREGETVTLDLVPVQRISDSAYGFYDKVSGNFYTNPDATFEAGDLIDDPVEIYTDGTPEELTVNGINLLDPSTNNVIIGEALSPQGQPITAQNNWRTDYIPIVGGKIYIFYGRMKSDEAISAYCRMNFYTADKTPITPRPDYVINTPIVATAPSNAAYVRLSSAPYNSQAAVTRDIFELFNWTFAEGSAEIPYEPYVQPQTVTDIPMLLSVGDYKDEAELISGIKTGKVGVLVLDGTEDWQRGSTSDRPFYLSSSIDDSYALPNTPFCTHFQGVASTVTSLDMPDFTIRCGYVGYERFLYIKYKDLYSGGVNAFKTYLSAQYAAGTPVIVIYPLATETTEQTTAYPQLVNAKYDTASVTAAVSGIQVTFTTGEQTTPSPYSPLPIVCNNGELKWNGTAVVTDGTPEVLTVSGANLFDASSYTEINAYVNANTGVLTAGSPGSLTQYCVVIPCKPNAQYNITGRGTSAWGAFPSDSIGTAATEFNKGGILTTGPNDRYLIGLVRANGDSIDYRNTLVVQEAQTASVPMLLSAGNYKDEADIINGIKTGKVGVYVFTGEEAFTKGTAFYTSNTYFLPSKAGSITPICTHFKGISSSASRVADSLTMTVNGPSGTFRGCVYFYADRSLYATGADFRAWLASEYAAGTPVIVIYPLAEETQETVTPQPLTTSDGTNTVSVTSNVDPVELEIEYSASA